MQNEDQLFVLHSAVIVEATAQCTWAGGTVFMAPGCSLGFYFTSADTVAAMSRLDWPTAIS